VSGGSHEGTQTEVQIRPEDTEQGAGSPAYTFPQRFETTGSHYEDTLATGTPLKR